MLFGAITVTFPCYTLSMLDLGNQDVGKSAVKSRGMSGNFVLPGEWSP